MQTEDSQFISRTHPVLQARERMLSATRYHYGGGGDGGAAEAEAKRQANLDKGMADIGNIFSKYTPDFYAERGKAYTQFAMPQVQKQFADTKRSLAYALARNGTLNSSTADQRGQDLQTEYQKNLTTVGNQAQGQENQLRQQVSDTRSNLVNQLVSSNDPSIVLSNGNAMTAGLSTTPSFNSLGNMFGDWANTYVNNMNARAFNPTTPSLTQQLGFA